MKRGEIWDIELNPTRGAEIKGKPRRPAVIISDDNVGLLPLKVIVPLTGWKDIFERFPWMVRVLPDDTNGLDKISAIDALQIRSVDQSRLVKKRGKMDPILLVQILEALNKVIGNY